jgi:hypothetical protein
VYIFSPLVFYSSPTPLDHLLACKVQRPSAQNSPPVHLLPIQRACSVRQRRDEQEHHQHRTRECHSRQTRLHAQIAPLTRAQTSRRASDRDRIVDCLREDKVEDGASDQGRCEVCGEVMVHKELTVHQEEGEEVVGPGHGEEPG